jgi:hypothetical protein
LTWFVWKEKSIGAEVIWVITSTLFWGIEVSVFVFLFSSNVSRAAELIKRVVIITILNMIIFALIQVRLQSSYLDFGDLESESDLSSCFVA